MRVFLNGLFAETFAIQEQFNFVIVAVTPDVDLLAFFSSPVPVRENVQCRNAFPPGLIIIIVVLWESARVHNSEVRTDARPVVWGRLPAIIESGPDKTACQKRALVIDFPPEFGCRAPARSVKIISADVTTLLIIFIDAPCSNRTGGFGTDHWLFRKLFVEAVQVFVVIIASLNINDGRRTHSPSSVHR